MQGDIFQMEQVAAQAQQSKPINIKKHSKKDSKPQAAIYNEDDLSHLLYVNYLQPAGHGDHIIINDVDHEDACMLESPLTDTETPSTDHGSPMFSDCDSALDEDDDVYDLCHVPSHHRRNALSFEDGFEFPIFLGRQTEEPRPTLKRSTPSYQLDYTRSKEPEASSWLPTHVPQDHHIEAIDGPMMSWWPEPLEQMEHEWVAEKKAEQAVSSRMPAHQHVESIDGPMMSWWPAPMEMLEHEWVDNFYE
ncbi:hypothetical protein F5B20DRAFT_204606 [Whalleya microplaca]|nr:hypothetical protein F5B20DRAFT_204606 [Whalleya microplaca]